MPPARITAAMIAKELKIVTTQYTTKSLQTRPQYTRTFARGL